ncbi:MAG: histidine triad nucleotide-binding protein [Desulfobacteraceae bacterium]|jgi:histidine triad (HIT) family protein|nr:MAG: histidine triad nucleotide-binding protein [Desulfobacteraceae bacterium]
MTEENCIFCKIANGDIPADFVAQTDRLVVFKDIKPMAPVHLLIVPRRHIRSINDLDEADKPLIAEMIMTAREMALRMGVNQSGYRLFFNVEKGGGQEVFHLHLHLIGGWEK